MLRTKNGEISTSAAELSVACGERLSVHRFSVQEAVSELFSVQVLARSVSASIDLREVVGQPAALTLLDVSRRWCGVCNRARLVEAVEVGDGEAGLSTYELTLVPWLWWLTQRTQYRIFQRRSAYEVVREVLDEWGFGPEVTWRIDDAQLPRRPYLVQYGETDLGFVSRLLEEAGIAYCFSDEGSEGTQLVLSDRLHECAPRRTPALVHVERPAERVLREFATRVSIAEEIRPESVVLRDHDFRRPAWALRGEARRGSRGVGEVERYAPGAFLVERGGGGGGAVHEDRYGATLAARALESARTGGCLVRFETNAIDLRPGTIITLEGHPREELGMSAPLLVTAIRIEGSRQGDWTARAEAVPAAMPYRPAQRTPKPKVAGVQSATVIGPRGQEIHTDEHGRVQVQFPWDREEQGSCWLRVAQGWAGAGLGLFALPRVGQEVLVGFLEGDPDQPVVVGRLSNALNPPPLKLPDEK
ncbi:MAG TPA: type VI secretion system tip protein TssI/VgrG, partial [Candidatus Nanopelagicales bacterium]|nr:type VI secretion system tip protein TssI/VgrG [Candidatus Nanopelagicales bacterium]